MKNYSQRTLPRPCSLMYDPPYSSYSCRVTEILPNRAVSRPIIAAPRQASNTQSCALWTWYDLCGVAGKIDRIEKSRRSTNPGI